MSGTRTNVLLRGIVSGVNIRVKSPQVTLKGSAVDPGGCRHYNRRDLLAWQGETG